MILFSYILAAISVRKGRREFSFSETLCFSLSLFLSERLDDVSRRQGASGVFCQARL